MKKSMLAAVVLSGVLLPLAVFAAPGRPLQTGCVPGNGNCSANIGFPITFDKADSTATGKWSTGTLIVSQGASYQCTVVNVSGVNQGAFVASSNSYGLIENGAVVPLTLGQQFTVTATQNVGFFSLNVDSKNVNSGNNNLAQVTVVCTGADLTPPAV